MVNSQVTQETIKAFNLNVQKEQIPKPIPVIEVGTKATKNAFYKTYLKSTSGSATAYTTPTNQDFYLRQLIISYQKNATCDLATGNLRAYFIVNGETIITTIPTITLTAEDKTITLDFTTNPLKLDRGTIIGFSNDTFTAGVLIRALFINGFIDETSQA